MFWPGKFIHVEIKSIEVFIDFHADISHQIDLNSLLCACKVVAYNS